MAEGCILSFIRDLILKTLASYYHLPDNSQKKLKFFGTVADKREIFQFSLFGDKGFKHRLH
jgi:hypothetical protein